ncbi:hypothetical protein ACO1O0_002261 [Amphichorda felina]
MASSTEQLFTTLLRSDRFNDHLFPYLSTSDICAIRSTSSACCNLVTKRLFTRVHVSFSANTFTKQSRVAALSRIGHHIEHLTFYLPHTEATFLPPLIHPLTGNEISFLYSPHTSMGSVLTRPKYANTELGEILTQQYPPLFHAATNVPSFINAFKSLTSMRHLTIRCPGQDPKERYRRDIVDYALISLRIALERGPLEKLHKLSLSSLHPSAFNYLRHVQGFGCVPSASRRWRQIRKLHISVEAWDFYGPSPGLDHLKVLDDYIRNFAPSLEKLSFTWLGRKGPCPVALSADPLFAPPKNSKKLFHEVTSPMSPLPTLPMRKPMHFPKLRYLQIRNATMNAPQLKELIKSHRDTVREYDFESVVLVNNGNWDEALSPLERDEAWSRSSLAASSEYSLVTNDSDEDLPSPSAAVEAASRELLDVDLGGCGFSDEEREVIEGLSEEVAAAREASTSFTTNLKRRRVRRRRRKHRSEDDGDGHLRQVPEEPSPLSAHSRRPSRPHLKPSNSSFKSEIPRPQTPIPEATISAPILASDPHPVLLQPTVYDPSARHQPSPDKGISAVQRNIEQEEAHRRLAEDAAARISALRKAKQAVLAKLSREFCGAKRGSGLGRTADAVAACRLMSGREFGGCGIEVVEDRRGLESQSTLVPLMFSRA